MKHYTEFSAVVDSDYASLVPTALMFPIGSTDQSTECIDVIITNDNALENNETFTVLLIGQSTHVFVRTARLSVTIIDDDGKNKLKC